MQQTALLIDFDGTAAQDNVGMALIETFARDDSWRVIDNDYENSRIGSLRAYELLGPLLGGDPQAWRDYVFGNHRLDEGLETLVAQALGRGWRVEILSDGLDFYIDALLGRAGIELPVWSAKLEALAEGTKVHTPHMNPACGRCGTCKTDRIETLAAEGHHVIFVGDGHSDQCGAPHARRIFAKDVLAEDLAARGVAFEPFETLNDITAILFGDPPERKTIHGSQPGT